MTLDEKVYHANRKREIGVKKIKVKNLYIISSYVLLNRLYIVLLKPYAMLKIKFLGVKIQKGLENFWKYQ